MKENSITSPSQVVFDGLQPTDSSYNLKDLVPKGINMLNKLVEIFIRWRYFQKLFTAMSKRYTTLFVCQKNIGGVKDKRFGFEGSTRRKDHQNDDL